MLLLSRLSPFSRLLCIASAALFATTLATPSSAQTKRAFVVGAKRYNDPNIQPLSLPVADAEGIAASLRQVGFDDKNVKLYRDPPSKDGFSSEFNKFLDTVKDGDVVFFYFSGHGYAGNGPDGQQNFLLFGDVRSPIEFARGKATDAERKQPATIAALAKKLIPDYESTDIPARGISEREILTRIQQKKPKTAIIVLDACRTLLSATSKGDLKVGSMRKADDIPQGFLVMHSASYGQDAIERFGRDDPAENSLFTTIFRKYMLTADQDLEHLAQRVKDAVTQTALDKGETQEPDYINRVRQGDFFFVGSIGGDRFQLNDNRCDYADAHWEEIKRHPSREQLEYHLKRFPDCKTRREVQQALDDLMHGATMINVSDDDQYRNVNPCDRLAASEEDPGRPSGFPGVNFGKIKAEEAIAACTTAVSKYPAVVRYLFNLARAHNRKAQDLHVGDPEKKKVQVDAFIRYDDARQKGYLPAFIDLALMYDRGEGTGNPNPAEATKLLQMAAEQGNPLAMYHLAKRYRDGEGGLSRDWSQAYEWFAKAAEAGNVSAMVEAGWYLCRRSDSDPSRGVYWLAKAATTPNSGSDGARAKRLLGILYFFGIDSAKGSADNLQRDRAQALLWFAQAAEEGDTWAQLNVATMLENGNGLTMQQPQLAERYWRLAAYGGNVNAKVEFAERILSSRVLLKPENGPGEVVQLLQEAMELGSSRAALRLAKLYRTGEFGYQVRPEQAIKYAYRAIDLAQQQFGDRGTLRGSEEDNPLDEIAAGILLVEMAANGEAVDQDGKPLLTQDERDRLELYYGRPDPETKTVKVRSLKVHMTCGTRYIWIWDWGRDESPTEMQFRYYQEQTPRCEPVVAKTRETLKGLWDIVRKDKKFAYADIVSAQADAAELSGR